MSNFNDITGKTIITNPPSDLYRNNYEAIFGKKEKPSSATDVEEEERSTPEERESKEES